METVVGRLPYRYNPHSPERDAQIVRLACAGLSHAAIAQALRMTHSGVRQAVELRLAMRIIAAGGLPPPRLCSVCKTYKPASYFQNNHRARDGLDHRCKDCARERT